MRVITVAGRSCAFALLVWMLPVGGAPTAEPGPAAPDSLYTRMGGAPVVRAVVGETLDRVVADHRLTRSFKDVDVERIKRLLIQQICEISGGGCHYSGDSMREVHGGHEISEAEFYGLVEILRDSLRRHDVRLRERNELLALLAPMERDVVDVAAPQKSTDP
jgi:hemoglobin